MTIRKIGTESGQKAPAKTQRNASTAVSAAKRRRHIEKLYLRGLCVDEIVEAAAKTFPSANKRNVENDIHLIRERWRAQAKHIFDDDPASWFVRSALVDRERAIREGDLKLAYAIVKDIAKLAGVDLSDLAIDHRNRSEERVATWLELMAAERQRKNLPAIDAEVFDPLRLPAPADPK